MTAMLVIVPIPTLPVPCRWQNDASTRLPCGTARGSRAPQGAMVHAIMFILNISLRCARLVAATSHCRRRPAQG